MKRSTKPSGPKYERELDLVATGELLLVEQHDLLEY
jgi:hypothetical protein